MAFKAKLITDKKYYKLRTWGPFVVVIPAIILSFLSNYERYSIWGIIGILIVYVLLLWVSLKLSKRIQTMIGNEIIEIDNNEIRIQPRKSNVKEAIQIKNVDKIIIKNTYGMPQSNLMEIANEIKGAPKENYIILQLNGKKRRFDFEMDSFYIIDQLKKVTEYWEQEGFPLERV